MTGEMLFSQPVRCKSRNLPLISCTKIFPRLSPQSYSDWLFWVVGSVSAGKRRKLWYSTHWDGRNRGTHNTRVTAKYSEASQPSDYPAHEWNNYLRFSRYRLQPARLQPAELHMWHSVAGQVAQENTKHRDCSYMRWAREYARKTIGETHAWRLQLRWVLLTL